MQKLKQYLMKEVLACIDEAALLESFETYELSFIHFNRINNTQRQLDLFFEGAVKYLDKLSDAFDKELQVSSGQTNSTSKIQIEELQFMFRLKDEISTVKQKF